MASSLSNVNNLPEGIHEYKCKHGHDHKKVKLAELNINNATVFLNIQTLKMIKYNANLYVETTIIDNSLMKS